MRMGISFHLLAEEEKKRPALTDVEKMELEDLKKIVTLQEQQLAQLESENEKLREIIRKSVQSLSEVL